FTATEPLIDEQCARAALKRCQIARLIRQHELPTKPFAQPLALCGFHFSPATLAPRPKAISIRLFQTENNACLLGVLLSVGPYSTRTGTVLGGAQANRRRIGLIGKRSFSHDHRCERNRCEQTKRLHLITSPRHS